MSDLDEIQHGDKDLAIGPKFNFFTNFTGEDGHLKLNIRPSNKTANIYGKKLPRLKPSVRATSVFRVVALKQQKSK